MAGYDGQVEAEAILARIGDLIGGRIFEYIPDDEAIPRTPDGKIRPYAIVAFGETIMDDTERTYDTDASQVWQLPFTLQIVAATPTLVREISAAVKARFVDWQPTPQSDYMQAGIGGFSFPTMDTQNRPTRYNRIASYPVRINLAA